MGKHALRRDLLLLAALVAFCGAAFVLLFQAGGGRIGGDDAYRIEAVVPTAVALAPNAEVRMDGVPVGRVGKLQERRGRAILRLDIDREHAPVYRDARVQVRLKSLIGENYVEIARGTRAAGTLADGGTLPLANADDATQLDEVLSTFDAPTRRRVQRTLDELGAGTKRHGGDVNRLLANLRQTVDTGSPVAALLSGERERVAILVEQLGRVARAVGDRGQAVATLARRGRETAGAVAARQRALEQTLRALPGALRQTRAATGALARFSERAMPTVVDLTAGASALVPAVDRLPTAASATRTAADRLGAFAADGRKLLGRAEQAGRAIKPATPQVDALLRELVPSVEYLRPYAKDIPAFLANTAGMFDSTDASGHVARLQLTFGTGSLPPVSEEARETLRSLDRVLGGPPLLGSSNNRYPAPGAIGTMTEDNDRGFTRVRALPPLR